MKSSTDVVVVGGGIIGSGIALALASRGASVTVLERAGIAAEASSAAAGILAPRVHATMEHMFPLALASHARFPAVVEALRATTGMDVEYVRSGALDLAFEEAGEEALRDKVQWLRAAGHDVQWLSREETLAREPALAPDVRGAFFDADAYQVNPIRLTHATAQAAARRGARFELGVEVIGLDYEGDRATAVRTTTGRVEAGHVVLAAGAWMGHYGSWTPRPVPVFPVKGQILTLYAVPPPIRTVVFGRARYLLPRVDGTVVVGATYEPVGFDKTLTAKGIGGLLGAIPSLCPALADARIDRTWAGLRPGSADELPIIGPAPETANVTLAAGHFRNGIMLAPITWELVADLILAGRTDPLLDPLSPSRFP